MAVKDFAESKACFKAVKEIYAIILTPVFIELDKTTCHTAILFTSGLN